MSSGKRKKKVVPKSTIENLIGMRDSVKVGVLCRLKIRTEKHIGL